jgi:WD40 repeat protein
VDTDRQRRGARGYDAFISYSRGADRELAATLQSALQRFAKPWYRLRVLRVFRDDASLSASPGLWESIATAIAASDAFILLASATAAQSEWVDREVAYWLEHGDRRRLLIVLTHGELAWDKAASDFDRSRTTAIPPAMHGAFTEAPRYVDLRWAEGATDLSLRDQRFREAVADVAAPLHGRPKDDLIGEEVRQHRRALRLARGGATALAILAVAAVTAAVLAVQSRNRANEQAQVATSRQLAAEATSALQDGELDHGLLLAAQAFDTRGTAEARSALAEALTASRHLSRLQREQPLELAAASGDGGTLAVVRRNGPTILRETATGRVLASLPLSARATAVAVGDGGRKVAVSAVGQRDIDTPAGDPVVTLSGWLDVWDVARKRWDPAFGGRKYPSVGVEFGSVSLSDDASVVAWSSGRPGVSVIGVWSDGTSHELPLSTFPCQVLLAPDGSYLAAIGARSVAGRATTEISVWRLDPTGRSSPDAVAVFPGRTGMAPPGSGGCGPDRSVAFSPRTAGLLAVGGWNGTVSLWDAPSGRAIGEPLQAKTGLVTHVAFSPDGRRLVAEDAGGITIWNLATRTATGALAESSTELGVWFVDDETVVAVGSSGAIALSTPFRRPAQLAAALPGIGAARQLEYLADGSSLAILGDDGSIRFVDPRTRRQVGAPIRTGLEYPSFVLSGDATRLVAEGVVSGGTIRQAWDVTSRRPLGRPRRGPVGLVRFFEGEPMLVATGLHDASIRGLTAVGPRVRLRDSRDAQNVDIHDADGTALLETIWGLGIWDLHTGRRVSRVFPAGPAAWTEDGSVVATGGAPIELWDRSSGRRLSALNGTTGGRQKQFSPDGSLLVSVGEGLELWDIARRSLVGGRPLTELALRSVDFAPDGSSVATLDDRNRAMLWDLDPESWQARACRLAGRSLTRSEWAQFVGTGNYRPAC